MFERKDIPNLKKDIVLDVNLFDCSLKLHSPTHQTVLKLLIRLLPEKKKNNTKDY